MNTPDFPWWLVPALLMSFAGFGWYADGDRVCKWVCIVMFVAFAANVAARMGWI